MRDTSNKHLALIYHWIFILPPLGPLSTEALGQGNAISRSSSWQRSEARDKGPCFGSIPRVVCSKTIVPLRLALSPEKTDQDRNNSRAYENTGKMSSQACIGSS